MNRINIYILVLAIFLVGTAEFVVAGVLNFISEDLRISIAAAGQLITAFSLSFALGTPIVVSITSRLKRKHLLLLSLVVFIMGCAVAFVSSEYMILLVSRIILGLSAGVFSVVAISSVTKLVTPDKMGGAISMISLAFGMAMTAGVPIGIAVANLWGWQMIFMILGILGLLVFIGLLRLLPHIDGDAPVSFWQQFSVLKNPVLIGALCFNLVICISHSIMLTYVTPYLKSIFHMDASGIGVVMLALGIAGIIGSRAGGYSTDRWGSVRTICLTAAVAAISLVLLPAFDTVLFIGLALILVWMFMVFMNTPAVQTYFIQLAPQSANLVLSFNTSVSHFGLAVGAATGGIWFNFNSTVQYHPWAASAFYMMSLLLAIVAFSLSKNKLAKSTV